MEMNYTKLPAEKHMTVFQGPSGGTTLGITDVHEPLAAELNNTGGTSGVINVSPSVDWNDLDFGMQASETNNQPSLADSATYETFGASNYSGNISYFLPQSWDDDSNTHSLVADLTWEPLVINDIAVRIDGDLETSEPAADGQFVSVYRAQAGSEEHPFTPGESKRYTIGWLSRGQFAFETVVGDHAIAALAPGSFPLNSKGRIRASQQGRDTTNSLRFASSNPAAIEVYPGGFYDRTGSGAATVTISDPYTGDTATVTVAAITP